MGSSEVVRCRSVDPQVRANLPHRLVEAANRPSPYKSGTLDVQLDEERKAAMVSNLLVVLCADQPASPVVNTGTLYT